MASCQNEYDTGGNVTWNSGDANQIHISGAPTITLALVRVRTVKTFSGKPSATHGQLRAVSNAHI